jgi:hypothetical protein
MSDRARLGNLMPIAAELRHLYRTPEWFAARKRCQDRARGRCEWCGKPKGWVLSACDETGRWAPLVTSANTLYLAGLIAPSKLAWVRPPSFNSRRTFYDSLKLEMSTPKEIAWLRVVITTAHLDHSADNHADDNLAALCQRCHLLYDGPQHRQSARLRRDRETGQLRLELVA